MTAFSTSSEYKEITKFSNEKKLFPKVAPPAFIDDIEDDDSEKGLSNKIPEHHTLSTSSSKRRSEFCCSPCCLSSNGLLETNFQDSAELNFGPSSTLNFRDKNDLKKLCQFSEDIKWRLIYRASTDGFSARDFHKKCDKRFNTLTVIKTIEGYIFGGFTEAAWLSSRHFLRDKNAFLFSLTNSENTPLKIECKDADRSVLLHKSYGPSFGWCDIRIADRSNENFDSYSELHTFKPKSKEGGFVGSTILAGGTYFKVFEIEVFEKLILPVEC